VAARLLLAESGSINFDDLPLKVGIIAAKLLVTFIAVIFATKFARRAVDRLPPSVRRQASYLAPILIRVIGVLVALAAVGVQISTVAGMLAAVGLGATLLLTPVGQNLIAGFLAGIDDVVAMDDVITVKNRVGRVVRKGNLSLGVEMPDGSIVYVPNTRIIDDELVNHNRVRGDRIDVEILLDIPSQRRRAVAIMQEVVNDVEWRVQDLPPEVVFTAVNGDSLAFEASVWIEDRFDERRFKSLLLTALVDALEEGGISLGDTTSLEWREPPESAEPSAEPLPRSTHIPAGSALRASSSAEREQTEPERAEREQTEPERAEANEGSDGPDESEARDGDLEPSAGDPNKSGVSTEVKGPSGQSDVEFAEAR
jgi:small-conductance mechanosensitive channel